MSAWVNCDSLFIATEVYKEQYVEPLPNKRDVYVGSFWKTGKTHNLEYLTISNNMQEIIRALRTDFSGLCIKNYHDKSNPVEKAYDFSDIEEA
ncbi:1009_t:CDS:2 [Cetraspora pellucida]|uniref:1009_t:CDS:1 n=1 Tax=Cetraspora pellucida TaxID=1433469 RepID=A0A9N9D6T0_9GLOM|nr:1009_t:CDS:2 [Cetraspora pellucida]